MGDYAPVCAGYANAAYAASLDALGEPRRLGRSGGSILLREIPRSELRDAMGPYPIFACVDWAALATDIGELRFLPGEAASPENLIAVADGACATTKASGRGRGTRAPRAARDLGECSTSRRFPRSRPRA